ncbi:MAG: hypothetical protein ACRDPX_01745 [Gaiellaceae bacterium]
MPISLASLVRVFREAGVSLEANERSCRLEMRAEATNLGRTGLTRDDKVAQIEGDVFCSVGFMNAGPKISVVKYRGDEETYIDALNVNCSIYPYDMATERAQVRRLRRAFEALIASER